MAINKTLTKSETMANEIKKTVNGIDLEDLADLLGYEEIKWDAENDCWCGYGSSDPFDRSRDDLGGLYVAADDDELEQIANS